VNQPRTPGIACFRISFSATATNGSDWTVDSITGHGSNDISQPDIPADDDTCTLDYALGTSDAGVPDIFYDSSTDEWQVSLFNVVDLAKLINVSNSGPGVGDELCGGPPYDWAAVSPFGWASGLASQTQAAAYSAAFEPNLTLSGALTPIVQSINYSFTQPLTADVGSGQITDTITSTFTLNTGASPPTATQPCSVGHLAAAVDAGDECCPDSPRVSVFPDGLTFQKTLKLATSAHGGCPDYIYHWHRQHAPDGLKITPAKKDIDSSSPTLEVTASCPHSGKKLTVQQADNCVGSVVYAVSVTDSHGLDSNTAYASNKWCVAIAPAVIRGIKFPREKCTPQATTEIQADWRNRANNGYRQDAWGKIVEDLEQTFLNRTPLGNGSPSNRVNWLADAKKLWDDVTPDINNADKADELGQADPPDGDTSAIALPTTAHVAAAPCVRAVGRSAAQKLSDCLALRPSLAAYAQAQAQLGSVLSAALTSQNRYGTAVRADQATQSALQHVVTAILYAELGEAFAATDQAGANVARIGRAQGLFPVISGPRIDRIVHEFARVRSLPRLVQRALPGVTLANLERALRALGPFHGARLDIVAAFAHTLNPSADMPPKGWVTPAGVAAVVAQLRAQGDISTTSEAALRQALTDLVLATGTATEEEVALGEFTTDAQHLAGPSAPFLLAAERALAANSYPPNASHGAF